MLVMPEWLTPIPLKGKKKGGEEEMNNLKRIREKRKISRPDIAKATGLSTYQIACAEKDKSVISISTKIKIADFLGMLVKDVFPEEKKEKKK